MGNPERVWLFVSYPGEFEIDSDGSWKWKFVGNGDGTAILVQKTVSFLDLYKKLEEELKIDSSLHEMELKCLFPISQFPPLAIKSDSNVKLLIENCQKTFIGITLKEKCVVSNGTALSCHNGENHMNGEPSLVGNVDDNVGESPDRGVGGDEGDNLLMSLGDVYLQPCEPFEVENLTVGDEMHKELDDSLNDTYVDSLNDTYVDSLDNANSIPGADDGLNVIEPNAVTENGCGGDNVKKSFMASRPVSLLRIPEEEDFKVRDSFQTKTHLKEKLEMLAVKYHFAFKMQTSNNCFFVALCVDNKCKWRLRATRLGNSEMLEVRKYVREHSCSLTVQKKDHKHASYKMIGKYIAEKYQDANRIYPPNDIISDIRETFGYEPSYTKAHMAQKYGMALIRGKPSESYGQLPKYFHSLEMQNPGTLTFIHTGEDDAFEYCFMALGPCIRGFRSSIRRVISVDGSHLKSSLKGTLLGATCQDGNLQLYPLAYGVVDSENNKSWTWFFEKLKIITGDTDDVVILSDRAESIKHGFEKVFRHARHGFCTYHLQKNVKSRFRGCDVETLFRQAAEAYTVDHFNTYFAALCHKHEGIRAYLDAESFRYWSRAHFDGVRYNIMTTNHAESMNSRLTRAREFSIVGLLDTIRGILQKWFAERHEKAHNNTHYLTPESETELLKRYNQTRGLVVKVIQPPHVFEVRDRGTLYIVDLKVRQCVCRKFDLDKFPCAHAVAAARHIGEDGYRYCSEYYTTSYWKQSYSEFVFPLLNEEARAYPEDVVGRNVLPPVLIKNQSGRPSKKRKKSAGELRKPAKCARCQGIGHNRATCFRLIEDSG